MREQRDPNNIDNAAYVRAVHDRGLAFDLGTMSRRSVLAAVGGVGVVAFLGGQSASAADCLEEVESETAGPYPADGSNGIDVRTASGIVRSDIRSSFGDASGTAEGVPLTFSLTIQDLTCTPIVGAAVYAWHCDRDGNYSLYSTAITDQNYLRGIQATDETGTVTFTSIYPACYSGRWPHIHFEVYSSVADATSGSGTIRKTSQIALPEATDEVVYATEGYSSSVTNLAQITLATDNVFSDDNAAREMATVSGNTTDGYTASLTVTIDPEAAETGGGTPPTGAPPTDVPTATPTDTATATASATASATSTATASATASATATARPSATATAKPKPPQKSPKKRHPRWWWPFG
ncbi:MAG TPA: intradiol ring-cleavage dioxygenase [Kineosporiaceae bacterium]|nr:intradiol ring-cleavage dioxygenase [Kineosporiaceae bacterium]